MAYNNQKLVYASSFERLKQVHSDWNASGSGIYKAVVFTADGYIVTHGKAIKGVVDSGSEQGLLKVEITNGLLKVIHGSDEAEIMLPVHEVEGAEGLIDTTIDNGVVTVSLAKVNVQKSNETPSTGIVEVSCVEVDSHGRTTKVINKSFEFDKVKIQDTSKTGKLLTGNSGTGYVGTSDISISGGDLTTGGKITASTAVIDGINVGDTLTSHSTRITDLESADKEIRNSISSNTTHINSVEKKIDDHAKLAATASVLGNVKLSDAITSSSDSDAGVAATPFAISAAIVDAKNYAKSLMSTNDALVFAGTVSTGLTILSVAKGIEIEVGGSLENVTGLKVGYTFKVASNSKRRNTINGVAVEPGDMLICISDTGTLSQKFAVIQGNLDGAVISSDTFSDGTLVITRGGKEIGTLSNGNSGQVLMIVNGKPGWVNQVEVVAGENITVTDTNGIYTISTPKYTGGEGITINDKHQVSINQASSTEHGGIKLGAKTGTPVELDSSGRAFVNVDLSSVSFTGVAGEIEINGTQIGLAGKSVTGASGVNVNENGTFTVVESIEADSKGRINKVTSKSVTIKDTTYEIATASKAGLIKADVKQTRNNNNRDYAIYVDAQGKAWVNVPWTDEDTTYTSGEGISVVGKTINITRALTNELGGILVADASADKTTPGTNVNYNGGSYEIKTDSSGLAFVDVPWINSWRGVTVAGTSVGDKALKFSGAFSGTDGNVDLAWYEIS
jgi:hypothetical protein